MVTTRTCGWFLPILLLFLALIYGCGSVDGADGGDSIGIEIQARDAGDDDDTGTLTIDVVKGVCQEAGEDGETSAEPYGDTSGQVSFKYLGEEGADNTYRIDSYTVTYIPLASPDGRGGRFVPPDLRPLDSRISNTIVLSRNFTEAQRSVILIPVNTKREYLNKVRSTGRPLHSLYSLKVTFFGKKNRNDFAIESALGVTLGDYNRCPDGKVNAG